MKNLARFVDKTKQHRSETKYEDDDPWTKIQQETY